MIFDKLSEKHTRFNFELRIDFTTSVKKTKYLHQYDLAKDF